MTTDCETVPCETCRMPTKQRGTKRCDGCWEVESRLEAYIATPMGIRFVDMCIKKELSRKA